jgi:hypothetical protein
VTQNTINLPLERNDGEFWQFFEVGPNSVTIVTHVPQGIRDAKGFAQALNDAARRLLQFYGGILYNRSTDFRMGEDVSLRKAPAALERGAP